MLTVTASAFNVGEKPVLNCTHLAFNFMDNISDHERDVVSDGIIHPSVSPPVLCIVVHEYMQCSVLWLLSHSHFFSLSLSCFLSLFSPHSGVLPTVRTCVPLHRGGKKFKCTRPPTRTCTFISTVHVCLGCFEVFEAVGVSVCLSLLFNPA